MNAKVVINKLIHAIPNKCEAEKYLVYSFIQQHPCLKAEEKLIWALWDEGLGGLKFDDNIPASLFPNNKTLSLLDLVELFECLTPVSEKKKKGIVYTPVEIKDYIVETVIDFERPPAIIDPSCGCGAFLITAAEFLKEKYDISVKTAIENNLCGIDIDADAIRKTKILLSLLAYLDGEFGEINFKLYTGNALDPSFVKRIRKLAGGFDCVIGNPPYVRFRNLPDEEKIYLDEWESSQGGNVDLYMPFFEVGLHMLKEGGTLGYIVPNGYLQGVNGRNLRNYLSTLGYPLEIIDFRDSQVFKNVTSYTCISIIRTSEINPTIKYVRIGKGQSLDSHKYTSYAMKSFDFNEPWRMREENIDSIISKLENAGPALGNWKIRNGLATLKNKLFFFRPLKEDDKFYYREYNGKMYKIEKGICTKVVKPNIIKDEAELNEKYEIAIFPYKKAENGFQIIPEAFLADSFPNTYKFLSEYRNDLNQRDKGHGNYRAWYAYGRTQGMNNFGKKLLIPYVAEKAIAVLSLDPNILFYCGYALITDSEEELKILKCFLESDAFWYYIFHTSKPYSKGYMAFAKNYLVKFTIPILTQQEKKKLLSFIDKKAMNEWIWRKYGIDCTIPSGYVVKQEEKSNV